MVGLNRSPATVKKAGIFGIRSSVKSETLINEAWNELTRVAARARHNMPRGLFVFQAETTGVLSRQPQNALVMSVKAMASDDLD